MMNAIEAPVSCFILSSRFNCLGVRVTISRVVLLLLFVITVDRLISLYVNCGKKSRRHFRGISLFPSTGFLLTSLPAPIRSVLVPPRSLLLYAPIVRTFLSAKLTLWLYCNKSLFTLSTEPSAPRVFEQKYNRLLEWYPPPHVGEVRKRSPFRKFKLYSIG